MARNGTGTYNPPVGNPVVTGTVIQSAVFNTTISDIGNEITASLPRDGQAPMTGALKLQDGAVSTPSITFNSEANTGLFRPGAGSIALATLGTERLRFNTSGAMSLGPSGTNTGTAGQILSSAGAGAPPNWVTAPIGSAGTAIQIGDGTTTTTSIFGAVTTQAGLTVTGATTLTGSTTLTGAVLFSSGYVEKRIAVPALNIDLVTGNYFSKTITGVSTFTVSNVPSAGGVGSFILDLTNGGAFAITWWTGVKWVSGTPPTLTASGRDVLGFFTHDGGVTWSGLLLGKALV